MEGNLTKICLLSAVLQLMARLINRPSICHLDEVLFPGGLEPGHVIELSGEEGTGKSQYLLHLLATAILPASVSGVEIGGLNAEVLFIDIKYTFNVLRLVALLEQRLSAALNKADDAGSAKKSSSTDAESEDAVESAVRQCLNRFFFVRCSSSSQLAVTLCSLESVLAAKPGIRLVMLEDISAFYHMDVFTNTESRFSLCISLLKNLVSTRQLVVIATRTHIDEGKQGFKRDASGENKCSGASGNAYLSAWRQLRTHRRTFDKTDSKNTFAVTVKLANDNIIQVNFTVVEAGIKIVL